MKKILSILLIVSISAICFAQKGKISPYLRQIVESTNIQNKKQLHGLRLASPRLTTAFVKSSSSEILKSHGCRILAQWDDLYIVTVPIDQIYALAAEKSIHRIEANKPMSICNDTTALILGVDRVHEALQLPQQYTGKGVITGVVDIGFDFTHPTFSNRVTRFWDMIDNRNPNTYPFGTEYIGNDTLQAIQHSYDGILCTHGTHTAGSMAGNGYNGRYSGMAPESEIVLVCNGCVDNKFLIDEELRPLFTDATSALGFKYIFDYAESQGKPCVINFSEGSVEDPYNGQLYAEAVQKLVGPGKILVASIGNQNTKKRYICKSAGADSIKLRDEEYGNTFLYYVQSDNEITNSITLSNNKTLTWSTDVILATPDSILRDTIDYDTRKLATCICLYPDCWGRGKLIYEISIVNIDGELINCPINVKVEGKDADAEIFFATGGTVDERAEYGHNTFFPGNIPSVIGVGANGYRDYVINYLGDKKAYQTETDGIVSSYSSRGPTMDGRIKPDIVAPGNNILSSYNSFYLEHHPDAGDIKWDVEHFEYNGRTYPWNANSGTSMSTPIVAGIIALWLQANPNLSPSDIIDVFAHTATKTDNSLIYPNNDYGYGEINAYEGIRYILETSYIKELSQDVNIKSCNDSYNLQGVKVNDNYKGIVIKNGKKYNQQ